MKDRIIVGVSFLIAALSFILVGWKIDSAWVEDGSKVLAIILFLACPLYIFWYYIPITAVKQSKSPGEWISAKIMELDDSPYKKSHALLFVDCKDYAYLDIEFKSDLPFDVELSLSSLETLINGKVTHSTLENKNGIKIPRQNSIVIKSWRLNNWTDCLIDINPETKRVIELKLIGEDKKHKQYLLPTPKFNIIE